MTYQLKAATWFGLGEDPFFIEEISFPSTPTYEELEQAYRNFAIKHGVELEQITMEVIE